MADVEAQQAVIKGTPLTEVSSELRLGFVRKVYSILAFQLMVTTAVAVPMHMMPKTWLISNSWLLLASLGGVLVSMIALCCCPKVGRTFPLNYFMLLIFTGAESVLIGFVSAQYTAGTVGMCAGVTAAIFLAMTVYAWTTKSDFTGYGPYLMGFLFALIGLSLGISIMSLFGFDVQMLRVLYAAAGVLLFTMYIVYDTQLMLGDHGGHKHQFDIDDYIFAALSLYVDVVNLFMALLSLLGGSQRQS